jgi:hypothetical protein
MRALKSSKLRLLVGTVLCVAMSSCRPNTSVPTPIDTTSNTRIDLSNELYLDENSSPDLLGKRSEPERSEFYNDVSNGYIYRFGSEEWIVAQTWTRVFPLNAAARAMARVSSVNTMFRFGKMRK